VLLSRSEGEGEIREVQREGVRTSTDVVTLCDRGLWRPRRVVDV